MHFKKKNSDFIGVCNGVHSVTYLIIAASVLIFYIHGRLGRMVYQHFLICGIENLLVDILSSLKILEAHGELINYSTKAMEILKLNPSLLVLIFFLVRAICSLVLRCVPRHLL